MRIESYTLGRKNRWVDIIPDDARVLCWEFDIELLDEVSPASYAYPVYKGLLLGLDAVSRSKEERVWKRRFCLWAGDDGDYFMCATPVHLYRRVFNRIYRELIKVPGFLRVEAGAIPYQPLVPQFFYDNGEIGVYTTDDDLWGKRYRDEEYESGVMLRARQWESKTDVENEARIDRWIRRTAKRMGSKIRNSEDYLFFFKLYIHESEKRLRSI